ncbi:hypothetical protein KAR52_02420, partial [Candidatus Pacearchaeota archaeon]|nr:hypothetical protein [Candidatus Pacearchaeota archaeon]
MKKSVQQSNKFIFMLISFLFLIFLFVGNISAENCIIKSKVTCSAEQGHAILGLSGLTNAHGELIAQNNYENVLCCDFGFGDTTCDGTVHKILGLSDETNAHAEIPSLSNYGFPVCYDGVKNCVAINADSLCMDLGLTKIITLSADTNAHIGGYSTSSARKICCEIEPVGSLCEIDSNCAPGLVCDNGQCIAPVSEVYWALPQNLGSIIYNIQADVGTTTISMVLKYSGLPEGTQVDFDIYEKDFIGGYIKTISGIVDSDGHAYINWTISEGDIEKAFSSLGEGDELEYFYFKTTGMASNELIVTIVECASINSCVDYNDENSCEGDACETASSPLCDDDPLVDCWCAWDDINNECKTMAGTDEEFYCGYC